MVCSALLAAVLVNGQVMRIGVFSLSATFGGTYTTDQALPFEALLAQTGRRTVIHITDPIGDRNARANII
jgi:hypothetical protein